jgi:hypothetical protein
MLILTKKIKLKINQLGMHYIRGCAKITRSDNLIFTFLYNPEYNVFQTDIFQLGRTQECLHLNLFSDFLKTLNAIFSKKKNLHVGEAKTSTLN